MTIASKALLTALLLALPLPSAAAPGQDGLPRTRTLVVAGDDFDDGDTVEVQAPPDAPPRPFPPRIRSFHRESGTRLGVSLVDITPELRVHFGAPRDAGVLVGSVEKDSPASRAGIEVGDVLTSVDGERVETPREAGRAVRRKSAGETVAVDVVRKGAARKLTAKVEEGPREYADAELPEHFGRDLGREIRRSMRNVRPFVFDFRGGGEGEGDGDVRMDGERLRIAPREDIRRLRERLEQLERRLKDLEGRKSR